MDLIDREKVINCDINVPTPRKFLFTKKDLANVLYAALNNYVGFIKSIPAVEAEPVIHAHWIMRDYVTGECSHCGYKRKAEVPTHGLFIHRTLFKHCESCGSKMDEVI